MERTVKYDGEVYINADDLIERIIHHRDYVNGGLEYTQAHNHLIEVIGQIRTEAEYV